MEKKTPAPEELDQTAQLIEKAKANKSTIMSIFIIVLVVAIGAVVWYLVAQSGSRKADELVALADQAQNDSIAMTLYADAANAGYKSGNRAKAELGIRLYRDGKYEEAVKELGDCSLDDNIAAAGVKTLEGDCYVNLDQLDKAISCYKSAIGKADKNPEIVPFVLVKIAHIYHAQGNFGEEAKAYKTILDEYPTYSNGSVDIRKYYERALAASGK